MATVAAVAVVIAVTLAFCVGVAAAAAAVAAAVAAVAAVSLLLKDVCDTGSVACQANMRTSRHALMAARRLELKFVMCKVNVHMCIM